MPYLVVVVAMICMNNNQILAVPLISAKNKQVIAFEKYHVPVKNRP